MRWSSSSASISATSVGATMAARHTASHSGITGITSSATTVPRTMDNGIPITNSRNVTWPRRTTDGRSSIGGLVEQDHGQRQLGQDGEALRCRAAASITPNPNGPNTIPNATKISAGAMYHRFTSPETTA